MLDGKRGWLTTSRDGERGRKRQKGLLGNKDAQGSPLWEEGLESRD